MTARRSERYLKVMLKHGGRKAGIRSVSRVWYVFSEVRGQEFLAGIEGRAGWIGSPVGGA